MSVHVTPLMQQRPKIAHVNIHSTQGRVQLRTGVCSDLERRKEEKSTTRPHPPQKKERKHKWVCHTCCVACPNLAHLGRWDALEPNLGSVARVWHNVRAVVWIERRVVAGLAANVRPSVDGSTAVVGNVRHVRRRVSVGRQRHCLEVLVLKPLRHVPKRVRLVKADEECKWLAVVRSHSVQRLDGGVGKPKVGAVCVGEVAAGWVPRLAINLKRASANLCVFRG